MRRAVPAARRTALFTGHSRIVSTLLARRRLRKAVASAGEPGASPAPAPLHGCGGCRPSLQPGAPLQELVLDYVRNCRRLRDAEFGLYRGQPTLRQAIRAAALSRMADGTLHPHQRTASSRSLDELSKLLLESEADIARCTSFDELHSLVRRRARGVRGIGELTVYDVALRIGVWPGLNLEPDLVFLPSRTRGSLKALGVEQTGRMVEATAFPSELAPLRPREITDLLCAFREVLPGAV